MDEAKKSSLDFWNNIHKSFENAPIQTDDWLLKFEDLILKTDKPILDLGAGSGNDTLFFIGKGKKVIACDQSENAIKNINLRIPEAETRCMNFLDGFDFEDNSFDVVCADLCLHYFKEEDTRRILSEIERILTSRGYLVARVNSVNDVNHGAGQGEEVEHHLYRTQNGMLKRFFDEEDVVKFFPAFDILYAKEEIMGRYDSPKTAYSLCLKKKK